MTRNTSSRAAVRPSMNERLERAVAMSADFLRETCEDLRYAAIMAASDEQRRRAQSLSRAANTAKDFAGELIGAWVEARKLEPEKSLRDELREGEKVDFTFKGRTTTVGKNAKDIQDYLKGLRETDIERWRSDRMNDVIIEVDRIAGGVNGDIEGSIAWLRAQPGPLLRLIAPRGGERVTFHRGSISLRMPAAVPPEVIDVLFSIALPLDLDGGTTWPIESIPREVRELASDAVHNDETARAKIAIDDVCRALGLDAWIHERVMGDDVARPATREEIITKLEGIREAMEVGLHSSMNTAKVIAHSLEVVEDGLTTKLAERLSVVDREWFEALVKGSS